MSTHFRLDSPTLSTLETPASRLVRRLGALCMATAVLSSILLGLWESLQPVFSGATRYTLTPSSPYQLWVYGVLQALKPFGFLGGLVGFFLVATGRGSWPKLLLALAALGGMFYAIVWIMIAVTGRDDAIYIGATAIGSDARGNGGVLFLWLAPFVLGLASFRGARVPRWQSVWLVLTGLAGARIFGLLTPGPAMMVEGVIWLVVGAIVYTARGSQRS